MQQQLDIKPSQNRMKYFIGHTRSLQLSEIVRINIINWLYYSTRILIIWIINLVFADGYIELRRRANVSMHWRFCDHVAAQLNSIIILNRNNVN